MVQQTKRIANKGYRGSKFQVFLRDTSITCPYKYFPTAIKGLLEIFKVSKSILQLLTLKITGYVWW